MDKLVPLRTAAEFGEFKDFDGLYTHAVRAYAEYPGSLALQIRGRAPLVRNGKPRNLIAHAHLSPAKARELAAALLEWANQAEPAPLSHPKGCCCPACAPSLHPHS